LGPTHVEQGGAKREPGIKRGHKRSRRLRSYQAKKAEKSKKKKPQRQKTVKKGGVIEKWKSGGNRHRVQRRQALRGLGKALEGDFKEAGMRPT